MDKKTYKALYSELRAVRRDLGRCRATTSRNALIGEVVKLRAALRLLSPLVVDPLAEKPGGVAWLRCLRELRAASLESGDLLVID